MTSLVDGLLLCVTVAVAVFVVWFRFHFAVEKKIIQMTCRRKQKNKKIVRKNIHNDTENYWSSNKYLKVIMLRYKHMYIYILIIAKCRLIKTVKSICNYINIPRSLSLTNKLFKTSIHCMRLIENGKKMSILNMKFEWNTVENRFQYLYTTIHFFKIIV